MIKLAPISLGIVFFWLLAVAAFGVDHGIEEGVRIETRPVVFVYTQTNHVYTLWFKASLADEWKVVLPCEHMTITNAPTRMIIEWSVDAPHAFFWLQVDGQPLPTNNAPNSAVSAGVPAIPTGE